MKNTLVFPIVEQMEFFSMSSEVLEFSEPGKKSEHSFSREYSYEAPFNGMTSKILKIHKT